ncbi:MAG: NUDIX domain-containing protein [Verrucomicrobiota bacterium]
MSSASLPPWPLSAHSGDMTTVAQEMFAPRPLSAITRQRFGVGVIVEDAQGRILLEQRRDCGMWGLCGGALDLGESFEAAAVREVREETGLDVEITRLQGVYSGPQYRVVYFADNGDVTQKLDVVLVARITGGNLLKSHESETLEFFTRATLPAWEQMVPPVWEPLKDYLANKTGVIA